MCHARHAEKVGYDGAYAAGFEEGGHSLDDDVTTMVLTPRMVESEHIPLVSVEVIAKGGGLAEIIPLVSGERVRQAWETGDVNAAPLMVGQSIGLIHSVPTCAELLDTMMNEAVERLQMITANIPH